MTTYIALIRALGGQNTLPMKALAAIFADLGARDVTTYIQSGNVIFRAEPAELTGFAERVTAEIERRHGFAPRAVIVARADLEAAIAANPFPEAIAAPTTLHLFFLAEPATTPNLEKLNTLRTATERFELKGQVFYLHTPDGFGRSKLATQVEKSLGVACTARNWRSVTRIMEIAASEG